jgi:hypothetical protein
MLEAVSKPQIASPYKAWAKEKTPYRRRRNEPKRRSATLLLSLPIDKLSKERRKLMACPKYHDESRMLRISGGPARGLGCCLVALVLLFGVNVQTARAVHYQTLWSTVSGLETNACPALIEHHDGKVHIVAVAFNGLVASTATDTPASWSAWTIIGPAPPSGQGPSAGLDNAFYAAVETAPQLVRYHDTLYVIARGKDNNLYKARKVGSAEWSNWQKLTTEGDVRGRVSVALTEPADPVGPLAINTPYLHVVYQGTGNTVFYRRFLITPGNWSPSGTTEQWNGAVEGTIGSDGGERLLAAVRTTDRRIKIYRKLFPWEATWKYRLAATATGSQGDFFDLSNVVFFGDAFHLAFAKKYRPDDVSLDYAHKLEHLRVPIGQSNTGHDIASYTPCGLNHALAAMSVYRNKLVVAFTDPTGKVRYARWDNADKWEPWIGGHSLDETRRTARRPALGSYDRRKVTPAPDYSTSNYSHDLLAAMADRDDDSLRVINLSRAMMNRETNAQFSLYASNSDNLNPVCVDQNHASAPTAISDIAADGRPFYTELGFWLWTLPHWFGGDLYKQAGANACTAANTSGRFEPPCASTKYPVIMRSAGGAFICSGVWVIESEPYSWNIMHELTHTMSGMLGFTDNHSQMPTASHASQSQISLSALTSGYHIFGSQTDSDCLSNETNDGCPNNRATGFTGYGNNYDKSTRQHSFIGALYYYFYDGDQLREWIEDDQASGSSLLQQKYDWIKTNIYQGKEFKKHSDPLNAQMPVPTTAETFAYPPTQFVAKHSVPSLAKPLAVGGVAAGTSTLSLELGALEFEDPVDLYLLIVFPGIDIFTIKPDLSLQPLSQGLAAYKSNFSRTLHRSIYGDLDFSTLSGFETLIAVAVTAPGDLSKNYLWVTSFKVP